MDLENRLLENLGIYDPHLATFAKMRTAVYGKSNDKELHKLADKLVERHLLNAIDAIVPDDEQLDKEALALCERRVEVLKKLAADGYGDQFIAVDGLMVTIVSWAAAQTFTHWRCSPWRLVASIVLDEEG